MSTPKKPKSKLQISDILPPTFVTPGAKKGYHEGRVKDMSKTPNTKKIDSGMKGLQLRFKQEEEEDEIYGGAKKLSKRITLSKVPIVVKKCALSKHFYKNNMNGLKLVDVKKESDVRTWDSKEERLNHYKKIKQSIIYMQKGWFGKNRCADKGDMYVEYPYFDMRSCMKIQPGTPIPIPNKKFLRDLQTVFGGPLEVMYQMGPYVKYDSK